ncbi:MAG TPA: 3-oxoacyl-[acyl-carrier-protein] synthase III C-terminal domain-containing protein [Planctomycetota bacterium]|nr:3-oxoacyl-[acyl-carrier-protein] synthase III C-terminal domain-containing protein [Planctomycetota bacterium]
MRLLDLTFSRSPAAELESALRRERPDVVGLSIRNIDNNELASPWAIHPGGEKVINEIKAGLHLSERQVEASRAVLADCGNMSSPTVLFVLQRLIESGMPTGSWCMLIGAGAGLSAHALLLRV